MKGSKHRVLFQNVDDNINMGVIFNDPDIELYDIYWYIVLAEFMERSLDDNEGLITVDQKLNTKSCYVELHRNGGFLMSKFPFFSLLMVHIICK